MKVSEFIAGELARRGVRHVFGYQGANITRIIDAVCLRDDLRFVQAYHEQGAAFAANGYAQAGEGLGVAVASSGPGALNLVTGIANAFFDSIPTLFIAGDLSRRYTKNHLPLRQNGFQSTDIVSVVTPITKYAAQVQGVDEVRHCVERALCVALEGRRGPCFLSIPHWIQGAEMEANSSTASPSPGATDGEKRATLDAELRRALERSRRPLLVLGGGCCDDRTKTALWEALGELPLPAVASLRGLSALPHDHSSFLGFIGDYGNRLANLALAASDCWIVLGSRMDERQIPSREEFRANKCIVHVDIDPSEFLPPTSSYHPVHASAGHFLRELPSIRWDLVEIDRWRRSLEVVRGTYPVLPPGGGTVSHFLRNLSETLQPEAQVFVDVGNHQMCAAQSMRLIDGKRLFVSGGLGSMGYALPASIGGHLAHPERQTLCVTGDGGFMMNLQELQTIARDRLGVKLVVINNQCLGMVREHQRRGLDGRFFGSVDGYAPCDMPRVAGAFGLEYLCVTDGHVSGTLGQMLSARAGCLVEVRFSPEMEPYPPGISYPLVDEILRGEEPGEA